MENREILPFTGANAPVLPSSHPLACPLLSLPRELRFRILEYTDLITPWNEVTWSREHSGYVASRVGCVDRDARGVKCPPAIHHGCQFRWYSNTYSEPSAGCRCGSQLAAVSSSCACWAPPLAQFLICRTLYRDAQVVFFSLNRFVIHDFEANPPWRAPLDDYPNECFAASKFLKHVIPAECLNELRSLEIVFPPYSHKGWPRDGHAALQDWSDTIDWVKDKVNLPGLTVRLVMADASEWSPPEHRENMTKEEGNEILKGYARILGPLARLGDIDLGRFYAQFAWPWRWTPRVCRRIESDDGLEWLKSKERQLKERAEAFVMGARYERLYPGREEPPDSLWQRRFARDA
jgi:hypothetical protein